MQSVYFYTSGCRLNQAEGEVLQGILRNGGFRIVDGIAEADIVVINSCTVTEAADTNTRRLVNRVNRANPNIRIAVIGCQAQVQKKELFELSGVKWVIGTERKMDLAGVLGDGSANRPVLAVSPIQQKSFTMPLTKFAGSCARANLKIQDGCDNFCAYCEIPYARGRTRSRVFSDILEEAHALVSAGHREIVLTGINVGLYAYAGKSLLDVVEALHQVRGLDRIRISSIEHAALPLELSQFMFPNGRLCRFLHIPIQSGSDRILKRMGRDYGVGDYADMVRRLAERVPGIMIGTDVIVGFPGETDEDFCLTERILEALPVGYAHVFSYSHRRRAKSREFKGEVPAIEISRRSSAIRRLSLEKRERFLKGQIGLVGSVIFEQKKNDYWIGHADNYVTIKMRSGENLRNRIIDVKMVRIDAQSIIGCLDQ